MWRGYQDRKRNRIRSQRKCVHGRPVSWHRSRQADRSRHDACQWPVDQRWAAYHVRRRKDVRRRQIQLSVGGGKIHDWEMDQCPDKRQILIKNSIKIVSQNEKTACLCGFLTYGAGTGIWTLAPCYRSTSFPSLPLQPLEYSCISMLLYYDTITFKKYNREFCENDQGILKNPCDIWITEI